MYCYPSNFLASVICLGVTVGDGAWVLDAAQASSTPTLSSPMVSTVGQEDCDFQSLQAAIDHGKATILRVVGRVPDEHVRIEGASILIAGGFASCAEAQRGDISEVRSFYSTELPPVFVTSNGAGPSRVVSLHNLSVRGDAGVRVEGNARLHVRNLRLSSSSSADPTILMVRTSGGAPSIQMEGDNDFKLDFDDQR